MGRPNRNPAQSAAAACLYAPLLAIAVLAFVPDKGDGDMPDRAVLLAKAGFALLLIVVGIVAGALAFARARTHGRDGVVGRSVAGLLISAFLLAIVGVGMAAAARTRQQSREMIDQLEQQADALRQVNRAEIEEGTISEERLHQLNRMADTLDQASGKMSGSEGQTMRIMADVLRGMEAPTRAYQLAYQRFLDTGGLDPTGLASSEEVEVRLARLAELSEANEQLDATLRGMEQNLRSQLAVARVSADYAAGVVKGFTQGQMIEMVTRIRELDRQFMRHGQTMLTILRDHWGKWHLNAEGELLFEADPTMNAYNAAFEAMQQAADEQVAVQKELLDKQEKAAAARREKAGR